MIGLLRLDDAIFSEDFGRRPFRIRHVLSGHPSLRRDSLVEASLRFPRDRVENTGAWMVLKNAERLPSLAWLLEACLGEVATHSERIEPGMRQREAFVFVTAPGNVTPFHMDPEHNFLLQIEGTKTVHLFDGTDREILSERALEKFYTGGGRNLEWRPELQRKARSFTLRPGDGLYFPVTHPHWVENGPEASVSFSVTFRTPAVDARDRLYKMNAKLRSLGVPIVPPGRAPAMDRAKLLAFEAARRAKRIFTREEPVADSSGY